MSKQSTIHSLFGMLNIPEAVLAQIEEASFTERMAGTEIEQGGKKITLPEGMSLQDAINWLQRRHKEEESNVDIEERINAFPFDAAHALKDVIEMEYGIALTKGAEIPTLFGPIRLNVRYLNIETSPGVYTQVPWGAITLPKINAEIAMNFAEKNGRVVLSIDGRVKGKHREALQELFAQVRERVSTHSIYKGKAIRMDFRNDDGARLQPNPDLHPTFMPLAEAERAIFNDDTQQQLQVAMLNPIIHTERLRSRGIPVGRRILLEGDYGTGKTLTAALTAKTCVANGWTFVYVTDCRDLDQGMKIAQQYAPAVVFIEDVDHIVKLSDKDDREYEIQKLSTCLDGVDNKDKEVMVIMTTNDVHSIPRVLQRPGRMDAIIHIARPDENTTVKLVRHYGTGLIGDVKDKDIADAMEKVVGQSASFIREVVERAKLSATANENPEITTNDLKIASDMMTHHAEVLATADA